MHLLWSRTTFGGISERVRCQIEAQNMRMKTQWVKKQWDKERLCKMQNNFIKRKNRAWFPYKTERIDDKNAQKRRTTTANIFNNVLFPFWVGRARSNKKRRWSSRRSAFLKLLHRADTVAVGAGGTADSWYPQCSGLLNYFWIKINYLIDIFWPSRVFFERLDDIEVIFLTLKSWNGPLYDDILSTLLRMLYNFVSKLIDKLHS